MYGAIIGDIVGSRFEHTGCKQIDFEFFTNTCRFTDDSVMSVAIADALLSCDFNASADEIGNACIDAMHKWGNKYPNAGYGGHFMQWILDKDWEPYNSWGNGSAMRVSATGWLYDSIDRTREVARITAAVTHNHPEGIKGAEAIASCIFLARNGYSKQYIKSYIEKEFYNNLNRSIDDIRPSYRFDVSCQGSVPESIIAFLDSDSFEEAIRLAVSLGGDTDTQGAMAGSIAEAFYGIDDKYITESKKYLTKEIIDVLDRI